MMTRRDSASWGSASAAAASTAASTAAASSSSSVLAEVEDAMRLQSLERFIRRMDTKDRTASISRRAQVETARRGYVCGTGVAQRKAGFVPSSSHSHNHTRAHARVCAVANGERR